MYFESFEDSSEFQRQVLRAREEEKSSNISNISILEEAAKVTTTPEDVHLQEVHNHYLNYLYYAYQTRKKKVVI